MLSFRKSLRASLLLNYLVIVMVPLFAWGQESACREHATGPMPVQKSTKRFPDGRLKAEYWFYRGKDGIEVLHGKYTTWSESGQKFSEQEYLNGTREVTRRTPRAFQNQFFLADEKLPQSAACSQRLAGIAGDGILAVAAAQDAPPKNQIGIKASD